MQHFPELQLTFQEARVLGCLLEKEVLTPDSYPLTHNSLVIACNQSTSRDPITRFTAEEVSEALRGLSEKYLVEKILGGRAPKFEHCIQDVLSMQPSERAVLTVLLLRGPQNRRRNPPAHRPPAQPFLTGRSGGNAHLVHRIPAWPARPKDPGGGRAAGRNLCPPSLARRRGHH